MTKALWIVITLWSVIMVGFNIFERDAANAGYWGVLAGFGLRALIVEFARG
jgi:hypothetical protein